MALMLELLGNHLDFLAARGIGDQQCVGGIDDDQIVQADRADQASWRVDVAVADIMQYGFTVAMVALAVGHAVQDFGGMRLQFLQYGADAQAEHAGIPQVSATFEVALGGLGVRLFNEAGDPKSAGCQRLALFDIAEAGFGAGRQQAEGGQPALPGERHGLAHSGLESLLVLDQVVGRHYQQQAILAVLFGAVQRCSSDGGGGVTAHWLENEIVGYALGANLAIFVLGAEYHLTVGHREHALDPRQVAGAVEGLLQQAHAVGKTHERLGHRFARDRPQSGAGAASDDARDQNAHSHSLESGRCGAAQCKEITTCQASGGAKSIK
ncbi:hypothetical protein WR25_22254 [Diploscapter pachys]|uniref:Uncharacterized protein n=1 Tax=Diploscapter pachys TaxID=2018661 RepID=A0A2A2K6S9_9BILA|nr:hypothetical protein WR25_22254 [Diploscapter pachys]